MKHCKYCNGVLDSTHRVYCSRLCQNKWQGKFNNGFKGKRHSEETKKKWSIDRKNDYGLHLHKNDCSCSYCMTVRGELNPMNSPQARHKLSETLTGRTIHWNKKVSEGVRLAYKEGRLKSGGKDSPRYIDGRTPLRGMIRNSGLYREWRERVYSRDNYRCTICGDDKGGNLEAHHRRKSFSVLISEFLCHYNYLSPSDDKEALLQLALHEWPEFWDVSNGLTVCNICHDEVKTTGLIS